MHIVYVLAPGGGPEAYVETLSPWLLNLGHRVSIVYMGSESAIHKGLSSSVRVLFAPTTSAHYLFSKVVGDFHALPRRLRAWETAWAVRNALTQIEKKEKIDLVEMIEGLPLAFLRKRWRVLVRAHASDWTVRHFCQDGDRGGDPWLIAMQARQFADALGVSALSGHLAHHLSESCHYPLERIQVIPYPIDVENFSPPKTDAMPLSLLAIGRLERRKGVDVLLRALAKVWDHFPELRIYLLGREGDLTQTALLAQVPQEKRAQVVFPGFVDRAQLPNLYSATTLYVAPTMYETFGYTILEAMACGLPVVASNVGGIPELVDDGETGRLVPPRDENVLADAIVALLEDPIKRAEMGKRAREKASEYAMEKVGPRMLEWYQGALP